MRNLTCGLALAGLILASLPTGAETPAPAPLSTDPTQVPHGAYALDTAHGKITWSVNHLGFSTYYGQIPDVTGELELDPADPSRSRLTVRIGTASIDALHERLNAHLRGADFLDTARFPTATFASTAVERTSPTTARVNGDLTLHGVTKPVAFDATFNQAGSHPVDKRYTVGFDGRTVIKRSEFGRVAKIFGIENYPPSRGLIRSGEEISSPSKRSIRLVEAGE